MRSCDHEYHPTTATVRVKGHNPCKIITPGSRLKMAQLPLMVIKSTTFEKTRWKLSDYRSPAKWIRQHRDNKCVCLVLKWKIQIFIFKWKMSRQSRIWWFKSPNTSIFQDRPLSTLCKHTAFGGIKHVLFYTILWRLLNWKCSMTFYHSLKDNWNFHTANK